MADRDVRLYPTGANYIPGVRAVERIVPAKVADALLAYSPPAFTRKRPDDQDAPSAEPFEGLSDIGHLPEFAPEPEPATEAVTAAETPEETPHA